MNSWRHIYIIAIKHNFEIEHYFVFVEFLLDEIQVFIGGNFLRDVGLLVSHKVGGHRCRLLEVCDPKSS